MFAGTEKSTVTRGARWEKVAENLNIIKELHFKIDKRAVRDRYNNNLAKELRKKLQNEEKASGIETGLVNVEKGVEDLIEREDAAETGQKAADDQKK